MKYGGTLRSINFLNNVECFFDGIRRGHINGTTEYEKQTINLKQGQMGNQGGTVQWLIRIYTRTYTKLAVATHFI